MAQFPAFILSMRQVMAMINYFILKKKENLM